MKHILSLFLIHTFTSYCQDTTYNHFSVDAEFGLNNPIYPMTSGYDAATLNLWHVGLGFRYAVNPKFGVRLSGGYDNFRELAGTPSFSSEYYRVSLEGVANLGNIMDFKEWTKHIGLLFHMGAGYSVLNGSSIDPNHILHGIIGFTPQVRLSPRFNLYVDGSVLANIYQNYTYDLNSTRNTHGIDAYLINLSLGVQYNFGRKEHADWVVIPENNEEIQNLRKRVEKLEEMQRDDDNDGVANWLDQEPETPAGTLVDTKGRTLAPRDSDGDNIPDDLDDCPFEKGSAAMKGCPERSGSMAPNSSKEVITMIEESEVKFETDKADLSPSFQQLLKAIAKVMKDNPSYKLHIMGHADDRASEEYNMNLSRERANAARTYLIEQGVSGDRLTTEGFGETKLKNPLRTVEARAENRRVEFDVR
ncbi:OmpA family protein [Fluviicola chungangensis]|uniref:OmpA family protein n=1 Tax=Fluviicola chungangensis TaxID=2597671 RepID=A0A556MNE2_9FLAO|nr:OmpA family protein [Fluviicola chungangensis]TSJ41328.1 OmpA family protein [Fluviicola chungangensis]